MQRQKILLVEDEQAIADTLIYALGSEGFNVRHLLLGREALPAHQQSPFDLIILDIGLPDTTGFEVLKQLRGNPQGCDVPVIFLTARAEEIDRILGLELGADDYVCKPYSPRELVARVKAVLRRTLAPEPPTADPGPLNLHGDELRVRAGDDEIELTAVEFALLETLHGAPGRIFSRDRLMDRIYRDHRVVSDRTIDSHVKKLRRKLAELLPEQELIHSVYGVGYRYELPADSD